MQKLKKTGLIMFIAFTLLCFAGCASHHEDISGPIHMDISSNDLGLSGFILGTFLMLHAYIIIIISCIILILKDHGAEKLITMSDTLLGMVNIPGKQIISGMLKKLSSDDARIQIGSAGLVLGLVLAYLSAWIAL